MLFVVGGTQTRSVQCQRTDAKGNKKIVSDVHCTGSGLSKPISSQACNTQACVNVANDSFSTVQDSQIVILNSDLLSNDITYLPPLTIKSISNVVGGTATLSSTSVTFKPTAKAGKTAGFNYTVSDSQGNVGTAYVTITILPLPDINAYIFSSAEVEEFKESYTPPTLAEVFNSWHRFSDKTAYYPAGTTPAGEAASWEMSSETSFRCTVNSSSWTGFVSPSEVDNYIHTATLSSTATDDDVIGLVIAFKRIGSSNYALIAARESNGAPNLTGSTGFSIVYVKDSNTWTPDGTNTILVAKPEGTVYKGAGGWSTYGPTVVKVERIGSIVRVYCSPFKSTTIDANSKLEINLNDYSYLSWALDKCSYGYTCLSQQYSSFTDVKIEGLTNANQILDFEKNQVWDWNASTSSWVLSSETIQSIYGWPRVIISETDGTKYQINENSIVKIS